MIERIEALAIPPAWRDVWISPRPSAKLQATGVDSAGRVQYLYHPDFRAEREQAKFDKLARFADRLPDLRVAMAEHMELAELEPERICAFAVRMINLGWFRVGSERYVRTSKTYGITTLTKRHAKVRGSRVTLSFLGKGSAHVRVAVVDADLAVAMKELLTLGGGSRLFRYRRNGDLSALTAARLNDYIGTYLGEEFTAKDFRTWGGTLLAAIGLAERGPRESATENRRVVAAVVRRVAEQLGNTPAVARASYISPAVIEQYMDGRTIEDFRPRHLRVVGARDLGLNPEEQSVVSLLRSWRIRRARAAA
ncbi:MAG: DNA topoisomerase IB [Actinobacteria bacterium]|nr:DNA topoisomerase IB [Actinomycetota bacterium]